MTLVLPIKLGPLAKPPTYGTPGASGLDLCAAIAEPVYLWPRSYTVIPTQIAVEIPEGYEGQIRPRSGLAAKHGFVVVLGSVDSDYRGDVGVIVFNHGFDRYTVQPGDRIAQLVISPVVQVHLQFAEVLGETTRGVGGFGSTGR